METKEDQSYEDFVPFCQWQKHEGHDNLEIHLPGFTKQEIRVQLNNVGILTISGKQANDSPAADDQTASTRSRFHKEIKISRSCRADQIRAKFSKGILCITIPKNASNLSKQSAHNFLGRTFGEKLSKKDALKLVVIALVIAIGAYGIYKIINIQRS